MVCPLCTNRKSRRACPALGREICPVCCGTKRLTEIACPSDCAYLASARHHRSGVARQRERDFRFALPMLQKLTERAYQLLLLFQSVVRRYRRTAIPPLLDVEVADAAGALASTLETADRGIIYEHQPASLAAQRVLTELRESLEAAGRSRSSGPGLERDAAAALRRIERAARDARRNLEDTETAYLAFLDRMPAEVAPEASSLAGSPSSGAGQGDQPPAAPSPRIILP